MAERSGFDAEVVTVGAGVVGLAVAARLAEWHTVVVIEREPSFGRQTSSHNTGIVHAGMFYVTDSLKHRLCLAGNPLLYAWCETHSVRVQRTGKLIVALDGSERVALDALWAQAEANDVPGMSRLSGRQARSLEPLVPAVEALHSATSGVIDQWGYARSLEAAVRDHGGLIAYRHTLQAAERTGDGFELTLRDAEGTASTLRCAALVNAAGHGAPVVASLLGYPLGGADGVPVLQQRVNRGRYYDLVGPDVARAVRRPVYPIPVGRGSLLSQQASAGGLGLHLSVDIDGGVHLGPDTEWLPEGSVLDYRADDSARQAFLAAGRRLLPALRPEDLAPGQVGYRPKRAVDADGPPDFLIWPDRGYVHLGGIESPGLTASLAIADEVAAIVG